MKYLTPILMILLIAGCTSFQRALETAERTRESMEQAGAELRQAMEVAEEARKKYITTLKQGDHNEVEAALAALRKAELERDNRELDFKKTQTVFDQASAELERAKAEDNYFEGILGLLLGGIVGGGSGFLTGRKRRE